MADLTPEQRELLAEALSWTSGDMTRWMPDAHPDHNRWSWRGVDGHDDAVRQRFREQADALAPVVADLLAQARADALREAEQAIDALPVRGDFSYAEGFDDGLNVAADTVDRLRDGGEDRG